MPSLQRSQNLSSHKGQTSRCQADSHRVGYVLTTMARCVQRCHALPHWHQGNSSCSVAVAQQTHLLGSHTRSLPKSHTHHLCTCNHISKILNFRSLKNIQNSQIFANFKMMKNFLKQNSLSKSLFIFIFIF